MPIRLPLVLAWACALGLLACSAPAAAPAPQRETMIPASAPKFAPENDAHPPVLLSGEFESPQPVPGRLNTAGAEDSPFITPDGGTLYFFFTPDLNIPPEKQLLDGVTGIYAARWEGGAWGQPQRVLLQDAGQQALDGCEFVSGETMWFCSLRSGFNGIHWFTAADRQGKWQAWKLADFDPAYQVGELHFTADGDGVYFHSQRPGGKGGLDIWFSQRQDGAWQEPVNVAAVNTPAGEGWPALSPDGNELWFTRSYGIWRSQNVNGAWQAPAQIVASLAGEPSVDAQGNLYFVHHYLSGDKIIEADIYVAYRK